jgi:hypothetical protein
MCFHSDSDSHSDHGYKFNIHRTESEQIEQGNTDTTSDDDNHIDTDNSFKGNGKSVTPTTTRPKKDSQSQKDKMHPKWGQRDYRKRKFHHWVDLFREPTDGTPYRLCTECLIPLSSKKSIDAHANYHLSYFSNTSGRLSFDNNFSCHHCGLLFQTQKGAARHRTVNCPTVSTSKTAMKTTQSDNDDCKHEGNESGDESWHSDDHCGSSKSRKSKSLSDGKLFAKNLNYFKQQIVPIAKLNKSAEFPNTLNKNRYLTRCLECGTPIATQSGEETHPLQHLNYYNGKG